MYTRDQVIAFLTVLDIGIMIGMLLGGYVAESDPCSTHSTCQFQLTRRLPIR